MSLPSARNTSASYFQFQQSLDQYVFFSPLTMGGASGRAVKIHKDLFLPFFCVVDPSTHDGQAIIRQIENLRTTCTIVRRETGCGDTRGPKQDERHKTRLGKVNSAFHQVLIIKNLHVYYRVSQEAGDKAPSIYISSIRQINRDAGGAPGLYEPSKSSVGSKQAEKLKSMDIDGKKVYINGSAQSLKLAMNSAKQATDDINALLFYCPTRATDELGVWGTATKSRSTTETVAELANVLKKNQKSARGVNWYAEGEGINILSEAIKITSGELTTHTFTLINPITNTTQLIDNLKNKKAKLEGELFKYDKTKIALSSLGTQQTELMQSIGKLPSGKNYSKTTRSCIMKEFTGANTFVQQLKKAGIYRK